MVQGLKRVADRDDLVYQVWNLLSYGRRSSKCSVLRMSYQFSNLPEPGCKNAGQAEPDSLIQGKSRRDQILGSFGWRVYVLCTEFRVQVVIGLTANSPSLAALGKWPEYTPQYAPLQTINVPLGDHRRNLRNTVTSRDPVGFTACDPPRTASKRPTARLYQMTLFLALSSSLSLFLHLVYSWSLLLSIPSRVPDGGIRPFIQCCVLSLFSHFLSTERIYTPRSEVASHTTTST